MSAGWVPSETERQSLFQASPVAFGGSLPTFGGLLPTFGGPWLVNTPH